MLSINTRLFTMQNILNNLLKSSSLQRIFFYKLYHSMTPRINAAICRSIQPVVYSKQIFCRNWIPLVHSNCFVSQETMPDGKRLSQSLRQDRFDGRILLRSSIANQNVTNWTDSEWKELGAKISEIVKQPWEIFCMNIFFEDDLLDFGRSLMAYLESKDEMPNRHVTTFFISLLGRNTNCKKCDQELKEYFDRYMARVDLIDAASIEFLVTALANSSHYLDCLELVELAKQTHQPSFSMLAPILVASLRNHNHALTLQMLKHFEQNSLFEVNQLLRHIDKIFDACLRSENKKGLYYVTDLLQHHDVLISKHYLDKVVEVFHSVEPKKWLANYGYIHNQWNRCNICHTAMKEDIVTEAEFQKLRAAIEDQVIVGKNIFFKSTPEELNHFKNFLKNYGPFDVVIDGLNVGYKKSKKMDWKMLERMINYFAHQDKKVLVLGTMILKYMPKYCQNLDVLPTVYACSSTRVDDVFYVYAALQSTQKTQIVTHDKLRDHKFLFEQSLRPVFARWLKTIRIYDWYFSLRKQKFNILKIPPFKMGPVEDDKGWHFPIDDRNEDFPYGRRSILCLRNRHLIQDDFANAKYDTRQPREKREKGNKPFTASENSTIDDLPSHNRQFNDTEWLSYVNDKRHMKRHSFKGEASQNNWFEDSNKRYLNDKHPLSTRDSVNNEQKSRTKNEYYKDKLSSKRENKQTADLDSLWEIDER